nr:MAG TPA: hypothetical protein [Caudoviricetes sp.]
MQTTENPCRSETATGATENREIPHTPTYDKVWRERRWNRWDTVTPRLYTTST